MAFPYPHKTRPKVEEVHQETIVHAFTDATTYTQAINLPTGAWAVGLFIHAHSNAGTFTVTMAPYADHDQQETGTGYKFLATGSSTVSASVVIAASATSDSVYTGMLIPAGDQYGAAAPLLLMHGMQLSVANTTGTGEVDLEFVAVEL